MLLLTLCMLGMAAGYAQTTTRELWMWKDANGVTHYSDTPEPGAIKIQIQQASPTAPRAPRPASASARTSAATPAVRYRVEITSPANGASFF
ncbi:MAG TPA: DUF4124 domain-containing protein, partial [Steroidobacteraceae bacterium]|nr:DUF4124 domain-containing protein [Steroidobacteraceae bacterium]